MTIGGTKESHFTLGFLIVNELDAPAFKFFTFGIDEGLVIAIQDKKLHVRGKAAVNSFPGEEGGMVNVSRNFGFGQEAKFGVVEDGLGSAAFIKISEGEDAGFFKGGVFGLQKVEAGGFELFLKGDGVAVFVQLLLDDEVGIFWEVFQVNDDFALGGGVFPCAIGVFAGGVIGGGEVEAAFSINPADFVGELGGEGLIGFVEGALADEVAGILSVPGDVPALALEEGLGFGKEAKGFEGGLGEMGVSVGVAVGVGASVNVGSGSGRLRRRPRSTVHRPLAVCGQRSAVGRR
jgi:hypothetical protein